MNTIIYTRNAENRRVLPEVFGFVSTGEVVEGLIELTSPTGSANILIH
jgi:hypothetical protein